MPVLPLVASITVWPGLSSPDRSAASITPNARRSLTDPSGLNASILTYKFTPGGAKRLIRTTGVWPTLSRMLLSLLMNSPAIDQWRRSLRPIWCWRLGCWPASGPKRSIRRIPFTESTPFRPKSPNRLAALRAPSRLDRMARFSLLFAYRTSTLLLLARLFGAGVGFLTQLFLARVMAAEG